MLISALIVCLALVISAVARWRGASPWIAGTLPILPAFGAFLYYAIRHDIDFGPHGTFPAWAAAGAVLLLVATISILAALGAGSKR